MTNWYALKEYLTQFHTTVQMSLTFKCTFEDVPDTEILSHFEDFMPQMYYRKIKN